ncbi:MAG: TA system VapC family ribonuclease toxin [Candidatus Nanopelagicales bacterium]
MSYLLDVNVLLALAWPNHVHHGAARTWFAEAHPAGWVTCGVTESGFIRVSSNVRVTPDARTPAEAALLLHRLCSLAEHEFVADTVSLADSFELIGEMAHSSSAITDAHLILLANAEGATFVTFDRQAAQMATDCAVPNVLLRI